MKVSSTVLVLYSAMLCIHGATLELLKLNQTGPASHILDSNLSKMDSQLVTTLEQANLVCPDGPPTSMNAPLMERAVCPWYLKETIDESRLPKVIEEAVCRCKGCLKVGTCVPSYADVSILRKTPEGGLKTENLKVAVACNCIMGQL